MAATSDIEAIVIDSFWEYASNLTYAACTSTWDSLGNTTAGHTFAGYAKELNISIDAVGTFLFACGWPHSSIITIRRIALTESLSNIIHGLLTPSDVCLSVQSYNYHQF
jgi:hypothetical protein